jgi:hypothetical protein
VLCRVLKEEYPDIPVIYCSVATFDSDREATDLSAAPLIG